MSKSRWTVVIGALALAAGTAAPPSSAEFPGRNGRITFMRQDAHERWQVWVANRDLTGQRRLTRGGASSGWSVWSPDGTRLVFDSDRADPDVRDKRAINDVFTMRADGTEMMKLTDSRAFHSDAAWSPDGDEITFQADRPSRRGPTEIYVMNADGSAKRRVTSLPKTAGADSAPRFSPSGRRLLFTRTRAGGEAPGAAIFTVRVDGRDLRRLTPFSLHAGDADWAPDGRRITFEAYPTPTSFGDVYTVEADGDRLRNVTANREGDGSADPVWSPDGERILCLDLRRRRGKVVNGLAKMRPDGSSRRFVARAPKIEHQPDWQGLR